MKLKNKYGFTLIELLAVIVVLAIIALIATPIVMNTIKNAKKGAAERTADNYIKQVETTIAEKKLENNPLADGPYTIDSNGNLTGNGLTESVTIDMSGTKPNGGTVTISNGLVSKEGTTMTVGDYDVKYNQENKKYEATDKGSASSTTVVYRWSADDTDIINIDDTIDPSDTSKFTKDPSTLGKKIYLKHVLDKDNKVTKSYACVKYNSKEYCLTNGEFGWSENESNYTGSLLILKKLEVIDGFTCEISSHGVYASCDTNNSSGLSANPDGSVIASADGGHYCSVDANGISRCGIV